MSDKNAGSNQAHYRCNQLDHGKLPLRPRACEQNDERPCTVKNNSRQAGTIGTYWDFAATDVTKHAAVAGVT